MEKQLQVSICATLSPLRSAGNWQSACSFRKPFSVTGHSGYWLLTQTHLVFSRSGDTRSVPRVKLCSAPGRWAPSPGRWLRGCPLMQSFPVNFCSDSVASPSCDHHFLSQEMTCKTEESSCSKIKVNRISAWSQKWSRETFDPPAAFSLPVSDRRTTLNNIHSY